MRTTATRKTIVTSLVWKLLERGGSQGIQFLVSLVLARLLMPEMYGTVALVMVFISLAQVFVHSGLGTALIQGKDVDNVDFSTVFFTGLGIAGFLYALIFFGAPAVAAYYRNPQLILILRVLALTLLPGAVNGIQNAWVSRNMMFKELFKRSVGAQVLSGFAGIAAAYAGLGIWALVIQQLAQQLSIMVIMWFTVKWRPQKAFSLPRLKKLFSFGVRLLLSSLLDTLYKNLRTLIIGRVHSPATLGHYNRGEQFPLIIVDNINGSIQAVMLPAFSSHQEDRRRVKSMMRRAVMTSCFLVFPVMAGLAAMAEPLVLALLTEKWLPAVPFLQVFCLTYALWPIHTANLQAINALGRSDIFLKLEVIKKIVGAAILAASVPLGVMAIAVGGAVNGLVATFINAWPNKRLLGYRYTEQVRDILPSAGVSLLMGAVVYLIRYLKLPLSLTLMLQPLAGVLLYVVASRLLRLEIYQYLTELARQGMKRLTRHG